jgi:hypothetical protein
MVAFATWEAAIVRKATLGRHARKSEDLPTVRVVTFGRALLT